MLTCIIIAHKRFEHYHLENLDRKTCGRIVFIIPEYARHLCNSSISQNADFIYFVESVDCLSIQSIVDQELDIQPNRENIKLLCNDEIFLLEVGLARKKMELAGATNDDYLKFRDKILMKSILKDAGVRVPQFMRVKRDELRHNSAKNYEMLLDYFNDAAFFAKPVQGASAIGAYKISSFQSFLEWIDNDNLDNEYNCEEYIDGKLYLCDSFVDGSNVIFSAVCEYSYPCAEYDKGKPLGIIPIKNNDDIVQKIINLTAKVCKTLNAPDGAIHLEAFVLPDQSIVFLEVASRPGGAGVPKILEINYGFNTYAQTIRQSLGLPISSVINGKHYAEIFWAKMPGKVLGLNTPNILSHFEINWNIKTGDIIKPQTSGTVSPIAVKISIVNESYEQLYKDFRFLSEFVPISLESSSL